MKRKTKATAKKMTIMTAKTTTATRSKESGQSKGTLGDHAFNFQYPLRGAF